METLDITAIQTKIFIATVIHTGILTVTIIHIGILTVTVIKRVIDCHSHTYRDINYHCYTYGSINIAIRHAEKLTITFICIMTLPFIIIHTGKKTLVSHTQILIVTVINIGTLIVTSIYR